jgi:hypothetical protein
MEGRHEKSPRRGEAGRSAPSENVREEEGRRCAYEHRDCGHAKRMETKSRPDPASDSAAHAAGHTADEGRSAVVGCSARIRTHVHSPREVSERIAMADDPPAVKHQRASP